MSNLFLRLTYFFLLLFLAFGFGWEFMMAGIVFSASLGRNNWEFLFLGIILDFVLSFPPFFFTVQVFAILLTSLLWQELFKTENLYNYLTKAFLLTAFASIIASSFYVYDFSPNLRLAGWYGAWAFIKMISPLFILVILAKMGELSRGKEIFFK